MICAKRTVRVVDFLEPRLPRGECRFVATKQCASHSGQLVSVAHDTREERIVLTFTGETHFSGTSNWNMLKRYIDDAPGSRDNMREIQRVAESIGRKSRW